jgi:hypothetical protein
MWVRFNIVGRKVKEQRKVQRIVISKPRALSKDQLKQVKGGGIGTSPSEPLTPEELLMLNGIGTSPSTDGK